MSSVPQARPVLLSTRFMIEDDDGDGDGDGHDDGCDDDADDDDDDEVIVLSNRCVVVSLCFFVFELDSTGLGRSREVQRVDAKLQKGNKTTDENKKENTMASWLKERRRAVGEMAQETMNNDPELLNGLNFAEADLLPGWTDGHQKELEFQRSKQEANRVEAYQDNLLIADDGVDEEAMKETVLETRVKEQKKDKDLIAARKRKEEVHHRNHLEMDWAEFSGQKVWLSADDANMEPRMK